MPRHVYHYRYQEVRADEASSARASLAASHTTDQVHPRSDTIIPCSVLSADVHSLADVIPLRWSFQPEIRQTESASYVTQTRTCYGDRSFCVNGPAVWNSLPVDLRLPNISLDIFNVKLKKRSFSEQTTMRIYGLGEFLRYKLPYYYYYLVPQASPIPRARKKLVRICKRWNDH